MVSEIASAKVLVKNSSAPRADRVIAVGYLLLLLSLVLFAVSDYSIRRTDENIVLFLMHYFIAFAYVVVLLFDGSIGPMKSWRKENIHKTSIVLNLFLVSAYALNRDIPVFNESVGWLCVVLVLTSLAMLSFRFFDSLHSVLNILQLALAGVGIVLYTYMAVYIGGFYVPGSLGILAIGVGAHVFVPLLMLTGFLCLIHHASPRDKVAWLWAAGGALIAILSVVIFTFFWTERIRQIERTVNTSVISSDPGLPVWVKVAQEVKQHWITLRMLKSELVYNVSSDRPWDFFSRDLFDWDEARQHDPFVYIASHFRKTSLSAEDRREILKAISDGRHRAEERFWSGENLSTSYIVTDVDIYSDLRLAYTEKYLSIRNDGSDEGRSGVQEAIYTFQLPEGSVVTSLSLWVNGKEEKGIMASRATAAKAYSTIVGQEARDPSLVQWQEGNLISLRVFPCSPKEERRVKIGITSPLLESAGRVYYRNIAFRGPDPADATETFRLRFHGSPKNLAVPASFSLSGSDYVSEHEFDDDLEVSFDAVPVPGNFFSFQGHTYSLTTHAAHPQPFDLRDVYLDINNTWEAEELSDLKSLLNVSRVFASTSESVIPLDQTNWQEITTQLRSRNFSLFPFHKIRTPDAALVITKGRELSPHLSDLKDSDFAKAVSGFFSTSKKVRVFNLGTTIPTYIRSFRELGVIGFASGDIDHALSLIISRSFPVAATADDQIVLHDAGLSIIRQPQLSIASNAPDHLARLFAYNDIMRRIGPDYFTESFSPGNLVDAARTAYVVSPVSSLVVLETKEDYKRFGIEDTSDSLGNASKDSSGAVPEPHEWILIILFLLLLIIKTIYRL